MEYEGHDCQCWIYGYDLYNPDGISPADSVGPAGNSNDDGTIKTG